MAQRGVMRLQRGAALLMFAIALVMGVLTYLVNSFSPESLEIQRQQKTQAALAEAQDALLGYALQYRERQAAQDANFDGDDDRAMYGFLPMPDVGTDRFNLGQQNPACNTEGCAMDFINGAFPAQNETIIGRLPWRTLGIAPPRDGYGECLWYAVSAAHKSLAINTALTMNWDTFGQLDEVAVSGSTLVAKGLTGHDRPIAMIIAPGKALVGNRNASAATTTDCGGNYVVSDHLEATGLTPVFNTTNGASGDTSTQPKPLSTGGKLQANSNLLANDTGLSITPDTLFRKLRENKSFRDDLKAMLTRMAKCWSNNIASLTPVAITGYSAPADKIAGRMPDPPAACSTDSNIDPTTRYGDDYDPKGYFSHYKEMIFVARPGSGTFTVNGDSTCTGVILFAGMRGTGQQRVTTGDKNTLSNYLESTNLSSFMNTGTTFSGDAVTLDAAPQASGTDIAVCVPPVSSPSLVTSPSLSAANQLVAYDAATHTLTLGKQDVVTSGFTGTDLFGCAWMEKSAIGNGVRIYFKFRFQQLGTNVGANGFVFAMADAETNSTLNCGMAGNHLGYSGNNGLTPKITWPKIGIEFDQGRNTGFPGAGESSINAGRNDPCGTTALGCAGLGYNSHAAIVYWGNAGANAADLVTLPDNDDNVHGLPATPPASRPPPTNPGYPSEGFAFKDFRGKTVEGGDSYLYHVRIELEPTRQNATNAENSYTSTQTKVWILADSVTVANQIAAMQNTTRPMNQLYPSFSPTLQHSATLFDVGTDRGGCANCLSGESCGSDNICYRPPLRNLQLGFTNAQRTTDQQVDIADYSATWIP